MGRNVIMWVVVLSLAASAFAAPPKKPRASELPVVGLTDDAPEELKKLWPRVEAKTTEKRDEAQSTLEELLALQKKARSKVDKERVKQLIDRAQSAFDEVSKPDFYALPKLNTWEKGELGMIGENTMKLHNGAMRGEDRDAKCVQRIDEKNALVSIMSYSTGAVYTDRRGNITGVVEPSRTEGRPIWLTGMDAAAWTDGELVLRSDKLDRMLWKVAGAKQYDTAIGGTNTVKLLELVDLEKFLKPAEEKDKKD